MKRKKWSELEERTLLSKYSDLLNSGSLSKLKTREKKFKPIADHVNSVHHLPHPINFPFRWSWRDVSIKVQNMRHQYLGVKQKIRSPDGDFQWNDGEHHWENFLKYKEVFGDVELESKGKRFGDDSFEEEQDVLGLGFEIYSDDDDDDDDGDDLMDGDRESRDEVSGAKRRWKKKKKKKRRKKSGFGGQWGRSKKLGALGAEIIEIRDAMLRREERRREREWSKEEGEIAIAIAMEMEEKEVIEERMRDLREDKMDMMESELQVIWGRKEVERRYRVERELAAERRRRMEVEEKWEKEEMAWREKMIGMQMEHEKQMAQMQADSCQNQNQILGMMARLLSQLFGGGSSSTSDAAGLLQNLQHHHHHHDKPETSSPSEFL